jgi:large subunit ribosomal protein L10
MNTCRGQILEICHLSPVSRHGTLLFNKEVNMIKEEKEKIINELAESLSKSSIVIATEYRGLTAKEMVQLRKQLRALGIDYKVAKNTLTRFAAEKSGHANLNELLSGPLALAFGYDDVIKPAKALNDYIRIAGQNLKVKGGLLGNKLLTPEDISSLAIIPSREFLIARLLGQLMAPIQSLHYLLGSPISGFARVLKARAQQLGDNPS